MVELRTSANGLDGGAEIYRFHKTDGPDYIPHNCYFFSLFEGLVTFVGFSQINASPLSGKMTTSKKNSPFFNFNEFVARKPLDMLVICSFRRIKLSFL